MATESNDLTQQIVGAAKGDPASAERLVPVVYDELRRMASFLLRGESAGQTLQSTALVHEALLRIGGMEGAHAWNDRRHFFNAAAQAMRRALVDRARRYASEKHGAGWARSDLDAVEVPAAKDFPPAKVESLTRALDELRQHNPRWSEVAHLRYFVGLTIEETAEALDLAPATVKSDWQFARVWLRVRVEQLIGDATGA